MRYLSLFAGIVVALAVYGCSEQVADVEPSEQTRLQAADELTAAAAKNGPSSTATVAFGRPDVGSPFPPAEHDRSFHAKDAIRPRTVVIAVGGTVTFNVAPFHYPAIYEPGIGPEDIDTGEIEEEEECPLPVFEDHDGRIAEGPLNCPSDQVVEWSHTFDAPGRYLVICQVLPHFVEANMYSWVIVQ